MEEVRVAILPLDGGRDAVRKVPVADRPRVHRAHGRLARRVKLPVGGALRSVMELLGLLIESISNENLEEVDLAVASPHEGRVDIVGDTREAI